MQGRRSGWFFIKTLTFIFIFYGYEKGAITQAKVLLLKCKHLYFSKANLAKNLWLAKAIRNAVLLDVQRLREYVAINDDPSVSRFTTEGTGAQPHYN